MNLWDKFDKQIDVNGLKEDEQNSSSGSFREVPHGNYEVKIEKLELVESSKGDPMVSIWFRILSGDFENSMIFYNQVINKGFGLHKANEFLRSLDSGIEVEFKSFRQYGELLMDIREAIDGKLEYNLAYTEGKKGFSNYEIEEVFETE